MTTTKARLAAVVLLLPSTALADPVKPAENPCPPAASVAGRIHECGDNGAAVAAGISCQKGIQDHWTRSAAELSVLSALAAGKASSAQSRELRLSTDDLSRASRRLKELNRATSDAAKLVSKYRKTLQKPPGAKPACYKEASSQLKAIAKQLRQKGREGRQARKELRRLHSASKKALKGLAGGPGTSRRRNRTTHGQGAPSQGNSQDRTPSSITGIAEDFARQGKWSSSDTKLPVDHQADPGSFLEKFFQP